MEHETSRRKKRGMGGNNVLIYFLIKTMKNKPKKNVKSLAISTGVSMMVSVVCVKS